ncbi:MAG: Mg-dependent DNase, partial [Bacteroidales bacterium]|nr:Mg-dependent DNase [Bacteroidales bacterium]
DKKSNDFFSKVPLNKIFFETDDGHLPIETVYRSATHWLRLPLDELCEIMSNNLKSINL